MRTYINKMYHMNDGSRSLFESIAIPEVEKALKDWIKHSKSGVLIGGAAIGYYGKPRSTFDVDLLFIYPTDIPTQVDGFKRTRPGAFTHKDTHVEVEVCSPASFPTVSVDLVKKVYDTAIFTDGIRVASPSAIVALKLQRMKNNDIGDIVQMIHTGKVDLTDFPLSEKNVEDFEEIKRRFA